MSTSVKYINNGMRGAPQISGQPGTLLAVLQALFVSGWGATTAVSVSVSGGVATAMLNAGETFEPGAVVLVSGATPGALNGESRVKTASNTSITWNTTAPDGVATGTITIKYAPQTAWVKAFAKTNVDVWRSSHVQSAGHYLRIDDTGTTTARVRGYESMTDVDTGIGPFPTDAQMSGGGHWWKSIAASAGATKYHIVCDERFILPLIAAGSPTSGELLSTAARGFGDPLAYSPSGDAWCTLLSFNGGVDSGVATGSLVAPQSSLAAGSNGMTVCPRAFSGLGGSTVLWVYPEVAAQGGFTGLDTFLGALPSGVDGQIKPSRCFVRETTAGKPPRARAPGVYYLPQSGALALLPHGSMLDGAGDLVGHRLMAFSDPSANAYGNNPVGVFLVDLTGPWR